MGGEKILIVEDDLELAEILRDYLVAEGFRVLLVASGEQALKIFESAAPSLVILDIILPGLDGNEICRRLRLRSEIPILFLSSKSREVDKILGLGLGADDYITKPFSPGEVVARVKAQLRRFIQLTVPQSALLDFQGLRIDEMNHSVETETGLVDLTAKEFALLLFFAQHPHQVLSKDQLYQQVWGYGDFGDVNTVTVHIRRLREKIERNPSQPCLIQTIWGVGYRFNGEKRLWD